MQTLTKLDEHLATIDAAVRQGKADADAAYVAVKNRIVDGEDIPPAELVTVLSASGRNRHELRAAVAREVDRRKNQQIVDKIGDLESLKQSLELEGDKLEAERLAWAKRAEELGRRQEENRAELIGAYEAKRTLSLLKLADDNHAVDGIGTINASNWQAASDWNHPV